MVDPRARSIAWQDPALTSGALQGKTGIEFLQAMIAGEIPRAAIMETLAFALVAVEPGFARFEGEAAEFQYNPMGTVHGGVLSTLLDSALGCAVMTTLDADTAYTTAQLAVHMTRPVTAATGTMIAEGRVVHRGNRVATAEGRLTDRAGKLLAHATTTCVIFPRDPK